jgi:hypothetical protein
MNSFVFVVFCQEESTNTCDRCGGLGVPVGRVGVDEQLGTPLQARRVNLDLSRLGELADAHLFDDDAQVREVSYREEPGELGYRVSLWALDDNGPSPEVS